MAETSCSGSHSRRHSRRSTGNINFAQMSVTPLTSVSLTEEDFAPSREDKQKRRSGSYIQGISAPSTPGILSRTPSFLRAPRSLVLALPKSKSSSQLARTRLRGSSEWLQRTGAALTSEARESKGQAWLSTRASSTSLVRLEDNDEEDEEVHMYRGDDEFPPASPMWGMREEFDYVDAGMRGRGHDMQREKADKSEEDDGVDLRGGYKLGQIIDRLIGWSVFAEDDTDSEDDAYEHKPVKPREKLRLAPEDEEKLKEEQRQRRDQDSGWQDPAWIFSIASNVLF